MQRRVLAATLFLTATLLIFPPYRRIQERLAEPKYPVFAGYSYGFLLTPPRTKLQSPFPKVDDLKPSLERSVEVLSWFGTAIQHRYELAYGLLAGEAAIVWLVAGGVLLLLRTRSARADPQGSGLSRLP